MPGLAFVYDNYDLTFEKVSKILSLASNGELKGTEKTDGYRTFIGFRDGQARFALSNGNMSAGGLNREELAGRPFAGGDEVRDVYLQAYDAFNRFATELDPREAQKIFGDGNIYFQSEIMGPGAPSILQYDTNAISIHDSGHKYYDQDSGRVKDIPSDKKTKKAFIKEYGVDIDSASDTLSALLLRGEQQGGEMTVGRTAMLKLQSIENDSDLRIALERIKKAGFTPGMTIENYLEAKLLVNIERRFAHFSEQVQQELVDYMLGKRSDDGKRIVNLRSLYSGFPRDQVEAIRNFVSERNNIIASAIWPIEDAIHDFTVEMLRGVESAYVLDNRAELARLRQEVREAIEFIKNYEGDGSEAARGILKKQLQKIKNFENISSTSEGFVFEFEGRMMKFTGNFTPVHKILSLFKYGSKGKGIPPLSQITSQTPAEEINEEDGDQLTPDDSGASENVNYMSDIEIDPSGYSKVMLFSGGFKPPHKAHLQTVVNASQAAGASGRVFIIMTGPAKKKPRSIKGKAVTFEQAAQVWNIFLNDAGLSNVDVVKTSKTERNPYASPMTTAYNIAIDMIEQIDQEHKLGREINPEELTHIYLIGGAKDAGRFSSVVSQYVPSHLQEILSQIIRPYEEPTATLDDGSTISATALRTYIEHDNFEGFKEYMPETSENNAERIFNLLGGRRPVSEMIMNMVRELIVEQDGRVDPNLYKSQADLAKKVGAARNKIIDAEKKNAGLRAKTQAAAAKVQQTEKDIIRAKQKLERPQQDLADIGIEIADAEQEAADQREIGREEEEAAAASAEAPASAEGEPTDSDEMADQIAALQQGQKAQAQAAADAKKDQSREKTQDADDEDLAAEEAPEELEEISSGVGSVQGAPGNKKKRKKTPTIFREEEEELKELTLNPVTAAKNAFKKGIKSKLSAAGIKAPPMPSGGGTNPSNASSNIPSVSDLGVPDGSSKSTSSSKIDSKTPSVSQAKKDYPPPEEVDEAIDEPDEAVVTVESITLNDFADLVLNQILKAQLPK
jgi:hypothetical protein